MIRGYVEQPSPRAGEPFTLRVSTDAPRFRAEVWRHGRRMVRCWESSWLDGVEAPPHLPFQDWGRPGLDLLGAPLAAWAAYRFEVPASWRSGVYVVVLVEGDERGQDRSDPPRTTPDGRDAKALLVVRPARSAAVAPILYKLPVLTYHAYNVVDGCGAPPAPVVQWCLYNRPEPGALPRPVPAGVSLHRPGGGTGAVPYDVANHDPLDATPRQTFVHWDARFLVWLEAAGYDVDVCTDVDLHRDGAGLLAPYPLMVSVGHDEYWSDAMRDGAETHLAGGGNLAFFSGNTAWWRVVFTDDVTFSRVGFWHEQGRPENAMTGVSFRNGGERDRDDHPDPVGYRVQHGGHWVYEGTALRDGDVFGAAPHEYVVGYECDGAEFAREASASGGPVVPTGRDGTPPDFTILGVGDVRPGGWGFGNGAATMGVFRHGGTGGTVFTAATTDWACVLAAGTSPAVERITRNVLDRLSAPADPG